MESVDGRARLEALAPLLIARRGAEHIRRVAIGLSLAYVHMNRRIAYDASAVRSIL